jgi:hypothetical protein
MPNTATGAQAAKHLSLTASEFATLIKAGAITAAANGKFSLDKVRGEFCAYAQKTMAASDAATAVQAAQHIHLGPSRFRDLVASGVFSHATRSNYSLNKVREEYCSNATKVMAGRAADGGASLSKQRARLATAQAESAERKNDLEAGLLVPVKDVCDTIEPCFVVMRERLLGLPGESADAVQPLTSLDRGSIELILRKKVYDALSYLAVPENYPRPFWLDDKKAAAYDADQDSGGKKKSDGSGVRPSIAQDDEPEDDNA